MQVEGLAVSSTEPARLRDIASEVSTRPEEHGVDFLWEGHESTLWGLQRKEISDFFTSVQDGRLALELNQMASLDYPLLLIEGEPSWTGDGVLYSNYGPEWTRAQFLSLQLTIAIGSQVMVFAVKSMPETVDFVRSAVSWSRKTDHLSLKRRPKEKSLWGTSNSQDYRVWLLQGIPGVGPKAALAIDQALGGSPFRMRVTKEELIAIDGIGPKTADAIIRAVEYRKPRRKRRKKKETQNG